jgi:hypothetical protein
LEWTQYLKYLNRVATNKREGRHSEDGIDINFADRKISLTPITVEF